MWPFNFRCLMLGHDDRIRRVPGRMYLECSECGRETHGWDLSASAKHQVDDLARI
jgi:hypothetical protein